MGNCCGSPSDVGQSSTSTFSTAPNLNPPLSSSSSSSAMKGVSQTIISNTTSSGGSNAAAASSRVSINSNFSAASGDDAFPNGQILPTPNLRIFSFSELKSATRNFRSDTLLGEGGFGKVFKGWLDDKGPGRNAASANVIAVKKLNSESMQGYEEWQVKSSHLGTH